MKLINAPPPQYLKIPPNRPYHTSHNASTHARPPPSTPLHSRQRGPTHWPWCLQVVLWVQCLWVTPYLHSQAQHCCKVIGQVRTIMTLYFSPSPLSSHSSGLLAALWVQTWTRDPGVWSVLFRARWGVYCTYSTVQWCLEQFWDRLKSVLLFLLYIGHQGKRHSNVTPTATSYM